MLIQFCPLEVNGCPMSKALKMPLFATVFALFPLATLADGFVPVKDRGTFLSLIKDRDLTRLGITLQVSQDGQITGKALGQSVRGAWRWSNGFFCRDLIWGRRDLGPNCQMVKVNGKTLRFISDQGKGMHADLSLD